jgi:hypothetical protein
MQSLHLICIAPRVQRNAADHRERAMMQAHRIVGGFQPRSVDYKVKMRPDAKQHIYSSRELPRGRPIAARPEHI